MPRNTCSWPIVLLLFATACSKGSDDLAPPPAGGGGGEGPPFLATLDGPQGFRMFLGGSQVSRVDFGSVVAYYSVGGEMNMPPEVSTRHYRAALYDADVDDDVFIMYIGTLSYVDAVVNPEDLHALLAPGPRPYGTPSTGGDGVELWYRDTDGTLWSTRCGSMVQTGAGFQIEEVATGIAPDGAWARVLASFQCSFHNCQTGAFLPAVNGKLVLEFKDL